MQILIDHKKTNIPQKTKWCKKPKRTMRLNFYAKKKHTHIRKTHENNKQKSYESRIIKKTQDYREKEE